jgi:hypothetical protein
VVSSIGPQGLDVIRYLRVRLFYRLVVRLSPHRRRRRMQALMRIFELQPGSKIIDVGGISEIWNLVETPLDITIVNLPGAYRGEGIASHHRITFLEGDATSLVNIQDRSFELAFSNSVIEHVGGADRRKMFASEIQRVSRSYFVQTPSVWFPLEAHTGIPFWWFIPRWMKLLLHRRWARILPEWNDMVLGTTVIGKKELRSCFPGGSIATETILGIPKSYCVYRRAT